MTQTASIVPNEMAVEFASRPDVGRDFISFDVPNGWDDVKKICKKVIEYKGRKFVFSAWNSDVLRCYFVAPIGGSAETAKILRK